MTKRLCKLNRKEIVEGLGDISAIVSDAKYLCRSCARSCQDRRQLCKPIVIPSYTCASRKPQEKQLTTVLTDTLANMDINTSFERQKKVTKKEIRKVKKKVKKQKKHIKKMRKVVKKYGDLLKKQKKIEKKLLRFSSVYNDIPSSFSFH